MEAKDTVMNREKAHSVWNKAWRKDKAFNYHEASYKLAQTQAEISFKAGQESREPEIASLLGQIADLKILKEQAEVTARKAGIKEVVGFAEKFLTLAEHGDYANGNEAFGIDEGRVRAGELLDSYRKEWQAKLKEWDATSA